MCEGGEASESVHVLQGLTLGEAEVFERHEPFETVQILQGVAVPEIEVLYQAKPSEPIHVLQIHAPMEAKPFRIDASERGSNRIEIEKLPGAFGVDRPFAFPWLPCARLE